MIGSITEAAALWVRKDEARSGCFAAGHVSHGDWPGEPHTVDTTRSVRPGSEHCHCQTEAGCSTCRILVEKTGAGSRIRTRDPEITNHVLYQLSYTGAGNGFYQIERACPCLSRKISFPGQEFALSPSFIGQKRRALVDNPEAARSWISQIGPARPGNHSPIFMRAT